MTNCSFAVLEYCYAARFASNFSQNADGAGILLDIAAESG
jgi:hypothetical protein